MWQKKEIRGRCIKKGCKKGVEKEKVNPQENCKTIE